MPAQVYRLYDDTAQLLYVGCTVNLTARLKTHERTKPWWSEVSTVECVEYPTRDEALAVETAAIAEEDPLHNIVGTPRIFSRHRSNPVGTSSGSPLMGAQEIATYLGVNRQRVQQLTHSPTFPPPLDTLAMGKVWDGRDVERWARERGRIRT